MERRRPVQEAESIIRDEHRCLATVLNCIESLVRDVEEKGAEPDFALLHHALDYIGSFLYAFHHPKETDHLFRAVRRRAPSLAGVLNELEAQHRQGKALIEDLRAALEAYERSEEGGFARFKRAVATYHAFEWAHMLKEEKAILPYARGCLTAGDWGRIDAVFQDYLDPVFGTRRKEEFQALFDKIVSLGPIGVKPHHDGGAGQ
jgi:branched-chain amino acid transport system ATP-binding protein